MLILLYMEIKIITDNITIQELKEIAKTFYVSMIKGVVDINKEIIASKIL